MLKKIVVSFCIVFVIFGLTACQTQKSFSFELISRGNSLYKDSIPEVIVISKLEDVDKVLAPYFHNANFDQFRSFDFKHKIILLILYGHKNYYEYDYQVSQIYSEDGKVVLESHSMANKGAFASPSD